MRADAMSHTLQPGEEVPKKRRRRAVVANLDEDDQDLDAETPETEIEEDEHVQMRDRFSQQLVDKQLAFQSPVASGAPSSSKPSASCSGLNHQQIAEHYRSCLKLSAENKINTKNAFSLRLIDILPECLGHESTNFQTAGSALDASAKIYACRVDIVHQDAYRVSGGLGRQEKNKKHKGGDLEGIEEEPREGEGDDNTPQKQKKKRKPKGTTIELNDRNLNMAVNDVEYEDDALFRRVCAEFDEGGLTGLLFNNVRTASDAGVVTLHALSSPFQNFHNDAPQGAEWDSLDLTALIQKEDKKEGQMALPSLEQFEFTNWDKNDAGPSTEEMLLKMTGGSPRRPSEFRAKIKGEVDEEHDEDGYLPEPMDFDDHDEEEGRDGQTNRLPELNQVTKVLCSEPQEYSYFDQSKMLTYKGPEHWKMKTKASPDAKKQRKPRVSRKKAQVVTVNFDEERDLSMMLEQASTAKETQLKASTDIVTKLDDALNYAAEQLSTLFTKPHLQAQKAKEWSRANSLSLPPAPSIVNDAAAPPYNYDNQNDSVNFCPESQTSVGNDSLFDDDVTSVAPPPSVSDEPGPSTATTQDTALQAPIKIEKIDIPYAKRRKVIDVKRLKREMWTILTDPEPANNGGGARARRSRLPEKPEMDNPTSFQELCDRLPSRCTQTLKNNLSTPIAFVCFLHMCNEKNLELEGSEELNNFTIRQG